VQSLALRDYCARKKLLYALPANENCFPHSYLVLEGLIADLSAYAGIVMCSMHMLPQRPDRRRRICERVFKQACALHLVLEDFVVAAPADVDRLEELLVIGRLAAQAPKDIALD
jgi:sporadic carbohydrate cluster protein (TIGR04323 family)